jgi:arylsulfatase A-like enzyme
MRVLVALVIASGFLSSTLVAVDRPNILWISAEDINAHFGCYGDPHAVTPHIDKLATEGMRYTHAFTTAGVCAPCRSGIITGMYQTSIGTQHMRSEAKMPESIKPFPIYLRQAGYYCTNNSKQDYQFETPKNTWDESSSKAHWRGRADKDQPFFSVFNYTGCHESGIAGTKKYKEVTANLTADQRQDPDAMTTFPPYYPDTPRAREDWKRNYELITAMDAWAGDLIAQLKEDGLYENTIIFYWSDHGVGLPRAKRWLYDSGTHIPLIVRIPKSYRVSGQGIPDTVTDHLVSSIDFGPTVLNLAGVKVPDVMQGLPFLGQNLPAPRDYVYGARDRMDERYDIIRMARDHQFKYIRNYEPLKTFYQYMNTPEKGATMQELRKGHEAGTLPLAAEYYFSPTKPVEELYDTIADPNELNNLADDSRYKSTLARLRKAHLAWVKETRDTGLIAEPILVEREKILGNRFDIMRQSQDMTFSDRIADVAAAASSGIDALPELMAALKDKDAAVRYWGAVGIGNIGKPASKTAGLIKKALKDESVVVRVAAARALGRMGLEEDALPLLVEVLDTGEQWERLHAAIVLDEMDEQARPVLEAMHEALIPREDLYANGKYVVRVINRALNQLERTDREVP